MRGRPVPEFAAHLGLTRGVIGYAYDTVPVALNAWMRYPADLRSAVVESVRRGSDTDSVAAFAGGPLSGGLREDIPADLLAGILEWPRTIEWMRKVATQPTSPFAAASHSGPSRYRSRRHSLSG